MPSTSLWTQWQRVLRAGPGRFAALDASTGTAWTRRALHEESLKLAEGLLPDAARRRVALCWPNALAWLAAFLAVQKQGGSVVPLDAGLPAAAQEGAARQAGADWLYSAQRGLVRLRSRRSAGQEVCVKLTSGSGGPPKRIECHASHLLADGRQIIRSMGITANDRNLALIPFGHSYGLGNLLMPLLLQGTPVVFAAAFVPAQIPAWIARYRVTVFPSVPAVFRVLAQMAGGGALRPLRMAISAGAPLPPETARAFFRRFGVRVHNFYGSSETGGICFDRTGEESLTGASLGAPLHGVRIDVLAGGRIAVRSAAVATPSSRFILPDLGAWTERGELRFLGRIGETANLGGKKVSPSEIEAALRGLNGVTDAWVAVLGAAPRSYLAAAVESAASAKELRERLGRLLPAWKLPRVLKTAAELPRTERGKLDRDRARNWLEN